MKRKRHELRFTASSLFSVILLFAGGCASQGPPVHSVGIGDTLTLRVAESATVEPRNVVLQFSEVVSDSRCPADVVCVWEGDAEVSVRAVAADGRSSDLRLHTKDESAHAEFAGLTVRLVKLDPRPLEGKSTRQADYELTLEIGAVSR